MSSLTGVHSTLATRVLVRLGWAAVAVIAANVIYAMAHNLFDDNHLYENIVRGEARRIAEHFGANPRSEAGAGLLKGEVAGFRVIDEAQGAVLGERNGSLLSRAASIAPYDPAKAVFQVSKIDLDGREMIWGVARHTIAGRDTLIEVALPADSKHDAAWHAVSDELSLHVWVPLLPSALIFLLLAHRSVHAGLAPLSNAIRAIQSAELAAGDTPKLRAERLTRELGGFLAEVEAAFTKHSSLLRSQQEFVGRVAHELRTPLTLLTLDLAAIDDPKARAIERDVAAMSEKITKMLAWARMDLAGQRDEQEINLQTLAEEAAAAVRRLGEERGVVLQVVAAGAAMTQGEFISIKEAVRNMVENAIKHTPAGARVTVTCGPGPRISVADNGRGFPKVDSVLLLQPFWKGDANTDGAGLGLALVKRVADRHGARISLGRSQEGGAEISLRFPTLHAARA